MNWITNFINKRHSDSQVKDIPSNMWQKCPSCDGVLFRKDIESNNYSCNHCSYYFTMPIRERVNSLFGVDGYKELELPNIITDPIKFRGKEKYLDKLHSYKGKTHEKDAALAVEGKIGDSYVSAFLMNFEFMGGSMGIYVGEAFKQAALNAVKHNHPLIAVTASGGARMQEGIFSLMQMAKTLVIIEQLKQKKLPYIVVLTNPTTGGVTASFAMVGDIHLAEAGATIGFAGKRVIEQTIRKTLPDSFQKSEYVLAHGMVDMVVNRSDLKATLSKLLSLLKG